MQTIRDSIHLLLSLLLLSAVVGCSTMSEPASASFASVTIKGHSAEEIIAATTQVFNEAGFRGKAADLKMVFEKEASRMATISRDGVAAAQAGARTVELVRAELVPLSDGVYRLQCQAYMVSGADDPFMRDEVAKTNLRSRPYQALLDKVAKALK